MLVLQEWQQVPRRHSAVVPVLERRNGGRPVVVVHQMFDNPDQTCRVEL
jgi:hypothetical protein